MFASTSVDHLDSRGANFGTIRQELEERSRLVKLLMRQLRVNKPRLLFSLDLYVAAVRQRRDEQGDNTTKSAYPISQRVPLRGGQEGDMVG